VATRLYLRDTNANAGSHVVTEKSTALPVGTNNPLGTAAVKDLSTTKGSLQTSLNNSTFGQTTDQDGYWGKWLSPALAASSISANTWTIALAVSETNSLANAFLIASIYVLTAADTVRGFIYDSHTALGTEFGAGGTVTTEDGIVVTVAGAAVAGVVSTDVIAFEAWTHAVQGMATSYNQILYYDGATDVTDTTTTDAASYIETPQSGLFAAAPVVPPKQRLVMQAVARAATR
jgi:hypothetical protein